MLADLQSKTDLRLHPLLTPAFLFSLLLLVINDHVLKQLFHNWLTGKLSDVAGLFAFALFWLAVFPRTWGRKTLASIGALFIVWKTELSEPLLYLLNRLSTFSFDRIVDYTDLWALAVLPAASWYARTAAPLFLSQLAPIGVGALSLVAFVATSMINIITYSEEDQPTYEFREPAFTLVQVINDRFNPAPTLSFSLLDAFREKRATTTIIFRQSCFYRAHIIVKEHGQGSAVSLERVDHHCSSALRGENKVSGKDGPITDAFEKEFIEQVQWGLEERKTLKQ
ncbi:MAG: hypothetical protein H8K05_17950 [Nitrospira sp.]|nr:hypothetical protein [Nitrospira sp.]